MSTNSWQGQWKGRHPVGDVHQRARKIISPSGGIIRGKFPSRKNGRMVHHEGLLELDAIYLFECSPRIVRYREQPSTIHFPDGRRLRRYTPDFELLLATGEIVLIEVKPSRNLIEPEIRHKFDQVKAYMFRSGRSFTILTEESIRLQPRLSALQWVYHQAARIPPTVHASEVALRKIRNSLPMAIRAASTLLRPTAIDPYSLLLAGVIQCSLEADLSSETQIYLTKEPGNDWFWIAEEYGF